MSTNKFLTLVNGVKQFVTAIATSTGAADANKIVATGSDGKLHTSLFPTGIGPDTQAILVSEALAAGNFVNIHNATGTPNARKADASNGRAAHGFVLEAYTAGQTATVYLRGDNSALSGLTPGTRVWLSNTTAGTGTQTAPTLTSGQILQVLGVATASNSVPFEYDEPIVYS